MINSSLNVSGTTTLNNNTTINSSLNVSGITNLNNTNISGTTRLNNNTTLISSLNVSGITTLNNNTIINGIANIHGGNPYAVSNNFMQKGSLTIGDLLLNYGGGKNWSTNTSGLMLECLNNTEIAVHDSGHRIASLMYFEGGGTNKITIGRNMGWPAISNVDINGTITVNGDKLNFPNLLN